MDISEEFDSVYVHPQYLSLIHISPYNEVLDLLWYICYWLSIATHKTITNILFLKQIVKPLLKDTPEGQLLHNTIYAGVWSKYALVKATRTPRLSLIHI